METKKHLGSGIRIPIKKLVTIGTEFYENQSPCIVTRVTDLVFDTLDKETGRVKVRGLGEWDYPAFTNKLSGVRGLLRISFA